LGVPLGVAGRGANNASEYVIIYPVFSSSQTRDVKKIVCAYSQERKENPKRSGRGTDKSPCFSRNASVLLIRWLIIEEE
jgi:hypothetical protein